jgi:hypothetical protein
MTFEIRKARSVYWAIDLPSVVFPDPGLRCFAGAPEAFFSCRDVGGWAAELLWHSWLKLSCKGLAWKSRSGWHQGQKR